MTSPRSRIGSLAVFVGDDAHMGANTDTGSPFSTDLYIRDDVIDPLVTLHLSPVALRDLWETCDRAINSLVFKDAKRCRATESSVAS